MRSWEMRSLDEEYNQWREARRRRFEKLDGPLCMTCGAYFKDSCFCHLAWTNQPDADKDKRDCWHPIGTVFPVMEQQEGDLKTAYVYSYNFIKRNGSCGIILTHISAIS